MCKGTKRGATQTKQPTPTLRGVMSLDPSAGDLRKARLPVSQKPQQEGVGGRFPHARQLGFQEMSTRPWLTHALHPIPGAQMLEYR